MDNTQPPPYPMGQLPPKRGWWQQNWKWFVPTGCVTLLILVAVFVVGIVMVVMGALKSADPYKVAVERAKANPQVVEALGSPISEGIFITGNVSINGSSGKAELAIPLTGSSGKKGTVNVVGEKDNGAWTYSKMNFRVDGSEEVIDLNEPTP